MQYRYLSHMLSDEIPVYGGEASLFITRTSSIQAGSPANTCQFRIGSHWGTHVDAPYHFFENGRKVVDYPAGFWVFKSPYVVNVSLAPSEILCPDKWLDSVDSSADILLIRSGWTEHRNIDKYNRENPGIHPDVGISLRKKFPKVRVVGIDWISVSPYQNRPLGREAHKAFLDPDGKNEPILIIEDMDLSSDLEKLSEVTALPLMVEGSDSAPCTVVGGFSD